jgi:hypothetical protein
MRLIPTDIYEDGDLIKIEYHNEAGEFVIEAVWDPEDEQTSENRVKFREWATRLLDQKGYEVFK